MQVDSRVPFGDVINIRSAAEDAGFRVYTAAQSQAENPAGKR
jgi:hypothetical protein